MDQKINLEKMELEALKGLQKDVAKAIERFAARKLEKAIQAAGKVAEEHGYDLKDLVAAASRKSKRKPGGTAASTPLPPKYEDPDNPSNIWSGRGRRPAWVKAKLEAGKALDSLKI